MRKVTLLLTTLLLWIAGTAPVLADASDYYSTADNIVVVTATSSGRGALTASADSTYLHGASYTGLTMSTEDNASYLVFYPADEEKGYYYIYSVAAAKLLGTTDGALTDGAEDTSYPLMFYISNQLYSGASDTYYAIWETNGSRYNLGGSCQTTIDAWGSTWGSDDDGNQFTFEVIEANTDGIATAIEAILATIAENIVADEEKESSLTLITSLDELTNSTLISLQTARGVAYYDGDDVLGSASSLGDDDATQQFVLYTTDDIGGYYLYSVEAEAFVGVGTVSTTPTLFGIGETSDESYPWYLYTYSDGTDGYDEGTILWLNNNIGSVCVDDWGTTEDDEWFSDYLDGGNMNRFVVIATDDKVEAAIETLLASTDEGDDDDDTVDLTPLEEALAALEEAIATYPLGDALGKYNIPGYTTEEVEQSIALAEAYLALESGQTQQLVDSIAEVINAGTASITINLPEAGTYLRIKSYQTGYYLSSDYSEYVDYLAATVEEGTGTETILYFDGTYLQSYATSLYAATSTGSTAGIGFSAESTDDATNFIFHQYYGTSDIGTPAGVYAIFFADSTYSLSVTASNYAGAMTARTGKGVWLGFTLEEVTLEESGEDDDTTVEALDGKIVASVGEAVSDIADFDGGTWYLFQVGGTGRTGYAHSYGDYYYNAAQGSVEGESTEMIASALFRVIPNEDGTYSLQDGEGNYLALDNSGSAAYTAAEGDKYTTFVIGNPDAETDASVWYLYEATATTILDTNAPTYNVSGWGQVDEDGTPTSTTGNNAMQFFPVVLEESDVETVELPTGYVVVGEATTDLQEGTWYYINNCPNGSRTGWIYSSDKTYYNAESAPDSVAADKVTAYLFRAVADEETGTYGLVNGNGYYFSQYGGTIYSAPINTAWVISKIDEDSDAAAYSALSYGTSYYLDTNGVGYTPAGWAGTPTVDGNECVYFVELTFVESLEEEEEEVEAPSLEGKVITAIGEAVTSTDEFDGSTYYLYQTGGNDNAGYAFYSVGGYFNSEIVDITGESAELVAPMLFRVVPNEDGTYSLVDGRGHYVAVSGSSVSATAAAEGDDYTTFTIAHPIDAEGEVVNDSLFYLQEATAGTILDTYGTYYSVVGYGTEAPDTIGDNTGRFIPVTLEDGETDYVEYPTGKYIETGDAVKTLEEGQWYLLNIAPNSSRCGYAYAYNWSTYAMSSHFNDADAPAENSLSDDVAEYMFRLELNEDGSYNIYNPEGGYMYMYAYWTFSTPTAETTWTIDVIDAESDTTCFSAISDCTYSDYEWSMNTNGNDYNICGWNSTPTDVSGNGVLKFIPVTFNDEPSVVDLEALLAAIEALEAYDLGDELGQYSASELTTEEIEALLAKAQALYESESPTATEVDAMISTLEAAAATVAINLPEAGTFLRIKSSPTWLEDQPYLGAYNSENKSGRAAFVESAEDDNEAATIFYYDGTYLINYETGYYLTNNSDFLGYNDVTSGSAVSFQAATYTDAGMYNVVFTGTSASRYLYTNTGLYTDAGNSASAYGYNFELEYVESLPVTTDKAGYATLHTPVEVALADGATVYEVTLDGDVLVKTQVDAETIGAGSAVLIEGDASTTYNFAITAADAAAVEGDLTGVVATVSSVDYAYTLGYVDEAVAFVLDEGEIKGFEAYLVVSESEAEAYLFDEDEEEEGIASAAAAADADDAQIYDLQGRAVSKTVKGGIYIIDGKKVYVK